MKKRVVLALAMTLLALGCSQPGSGGGETDGIANATAAEELQGSWQSNCRDAEKFGLTESSRLDISGTSATQVTNTSSTGACGTTAVTITQSAVVSAGTPSGQGRAVDITVTSVKVKPVTETGVGILNLAAFCGITDWQAGVERDVTGSTGGRSCFPRLPKTFYDIFTVDEGKLYFGKGDISSAATRPQVVDRNRLFSRR
jgi:hypothetical protein